MRWRFGVEAAGKKREVPETESGGLITNRSRVVLRTDGVVVEALLGKADALDPYALAVQDLDVANREADVSAKKMDLERTRDALQLIMGAGTPARQIAAWQAIYPDNIPKYRLYRLHP